MVVCALGGHTYQRARGRERSGSNSCACHSHQSVYCAFGVHNALFQFVRDGFCVVAVASFMSPCCLFVWLRWIACVASFSFCRFSFFFANYFRVFSNFASRRKLCNSSFRIRKLIFVPSELLDISSFPHLTNVTQCRPFCLLEPLRMSAAMSHMLTFSAKISKLRGQSLCSHFTNMAFLFFLTTTVGLRTHVLDAPIWFGRRWVDSVRVALVSSRNDSK